MNNQRFTNFNLLTLRFPFTAIVSILHRISGIFVFLLIPALLWMLMMALSSQDGFSHMQSVMHFFPNKVLLWLFLAALGYHLLAGVRHLVMDMGWGEGLRASRWTGALILLIAIIWAVMVGIWLW
jgi:succinate dehydrogenase / fumarate reductase cytochrome b subunit